MTAALAVLALAVADLLGWSVHRILAPRRRFAAAALAVTAGSILIGVLSVVAGAPLWAAVVTAALGILWPALSARFPISTVGFIAVIAALAVAVPATPEGSATIVAAGAVALFLGLSANLICRAALDDARRRESGGESVDVRVRTVLERRWSAPAVVPGRLRGGRLIGPLERWLIVALALVGAQGVIAALMAAKGIVRFPEISKDSGAGSTAEEFLIGSLVSWSLAGAGAALVWSTM